jgi:hypothetical protein
MLRRQLGTCSATLMTLLILHARHPPAAVRVRLRRHARRRARRRGGQPGRVRQLRHPGIILLTVAAAAQATAISVAMDMTEGIIARFRTMAISRAWC